MGYEHLNSGEFTLFSSVTCILFNNSIFMLLMYIYKDFFYKFKILGKYLRVISIFVTF